jgi:DNA-binding XRE family transcriptional regulator
MRRELKIPRILKIVAINGFDIHCMFNNGETRLLNFKHIFNQWQVSENDLEYKLLDPSEFLKVELRNYTLSWPNITIKLKDENGNNHTHPYEIDPLELYRLSEPTNENNYSFGNLIKTARKKAGLTQEQLAIKSGTTRFYISRVENNKTDLELSTFRKIVEAGLGKNLKVIIE